MLAGQPADHLDPASALAESALKQVAVADTLAVLDREVKVSGERTQVREQAVNRLGVAVAVRLGELLARCWATEIASSPGGAWTSLRMVQ